MFEELISAGIVSIVIIILLITLPGEAPLKRILSKHAIAKIFHYYTTFYLTFAVILIFWTICNWGWKSASFQSYKIIQKLEKRITKLLLLIILCIPCRYILHLMVVPPQKGNISDPDKLETIDETQQTEKGLKSHHKRHKSVPLITSPDLNSKNKQRDSFEIKDIKNLLFGATDKKQQSRKSFKINRTTPFQHLETSSTLYNVSKWVPLSWELFEIAGLFKLFAKVLVHGKQNIPQNKPCLIIVNHALGHGFDLPMIVYILRKYCSLSHVRVLVSPQHFNYPFWCDLVYYFGGVPRTYEVAEHLMKNGENIIMFAAKKKKTSMIWDNRKHLYLDLVHKFDYVLVPAVCVSDDDVINMVYNINPPSSTMNRKSRPSVERQPSNASAYDTDGDTDGEEEENKSHFRSLKTMHGRIRHGYRKQYHLRFSEPIAVPKSDRKPRKRRKSAGFRLDSDDGDFDSANSTPKSKVEVRFSGLEIRDKWDQERSISSSISDIDSKYDDEDSLRSTGHKRRWSHELEVGLKNAVEDAMTDGISEMYNKLKSDPNSSLLKTMQQKMRSVSGANQYISTLKSDIRSPSSRNRADMVWVD